MMMGFAMATSVAESFYLYGLIIAGALTLLYLLFSDVLDAILDIVPGALFSPTAILSFISIFCGSGFIFEKSSNLPSNTIVVVSLLIALILVSLIHIFILVPISKAETSLTSSMTDLVGKVGETIISIPEKGFGEVVFKQKTSILSYSAKSVNGVEIAEGTVVEVCEVDVSEGIVIVRTADSLKSS